MASDQSAKLCVTGSHPPGPPGFARSAIYPSLFSCAATTSAFTKEDKRGIKTNQHNTPPATNTPAIRGPMMYPTPKYSGVISPLNLAEGKNFCAWVVANLGTSAIT